MERLLDSVIGVSSYLDAGSHEDVSVSLFNVPGGDFDMSMLKDDQSLIAMPHLDTDGNEEYDFVESGGKMDGPYTKDGKAVIDDAKIYRRDGLQTDGGRLLPRPEVRRQERLGERSNPLGRRVRHHPRQ